jgi:hypothetical protein
MNGNSAFFGIVILALATACQSNSSSVPGKLFTDISAEAGIHFVNQIQETKELHILNFEYMYNGAGVAVGDVNGDGLADIYFSANQLPNRLYLNKGGLEFEDVTDRAGVSGKGGWKTGVTMADADGDGHLDIYVCYSGKGSVAERSNQLFINKTLAGQTPIFEEKAAEFGIDVPGSNSTQATFFDYDRDGDLDMFLLNHATQFYSPFFNTAKLRTKRHRYFSNYMFRNDGGHFTDVSEQAGIKGGGNNFGLGVAVSDINNDGWPDMYTTNDYDEQDFLYINNKNGSFREVAQAAIGHMSKYGMGCDVADYNNDGLMDIVVMDMIAEDNFRQKMLRGADEYYRYNLMVDSGYHHQNMRNTLQMNQGFTKEGNPVFSEIGQVAGVSNTDWSWASLFADFDNDGFKDLFITNGYWRDYTNMDFLAFDVHNYQSTHSGQPLGLDLVKKMKQTKISNYAFRNQGNLTFENTTAQWGLKESSISHGAAYADLDNDGDLDLVVNNLGSTASIYRNNKQKTDGTHYLRVKLKGNGANPFAIGAKVTLHTTSGTSQVAEMVATRGYQSSVEPVIHFGLGHNAQIASIAVDWPEGQQSTHKNIQIDKLVELSPGSGSVGEPVASQINAGLFTDISTRSGIDFIQKENPFVDFKNELLLPWQLSRQGPRLAKADVNGDGLEDIFIGAPAGQQARLYLQLDGGAFAISSSQPWAADNGSEDIESAFFDADGDTDMDLYVVSGGNESHFNKTELEDRLYLNDGKGMFKKTLNALPTLSGRKACVAIADYDKDGKPDIFVGGRLVAGSYGVIPESYLLKNVSTKQNTRFENRITADSKALQYAGMVTDAEWIDINKDGWPDLIVAGEWMPIKLFMNNKGILEEKSKEFGLDKSDGLWTRIIPADMDGDGDQDFVLGSLAPNSQLRASMKEPMTLCINDFTQSGTTVPVLCYYIQGKNYTYASRDEISAPMPVLKRRFQDYASYAHAEMDAIFTKEQKRGMRKLSAYHLKNSWLENIDGKKLSLHELPVQAQFSPIQAGLEGDFDSDGRADLFAAGNFYPFRVQLGRQDAGLGILIQKRGQNMNVGGYQTTGVVVNVDVRDMVSVHGRGNENVIVISKNNGAVQVLKAKSGTKPLLANVKKLQ